MSLQWNRPRRILMRGSARIEPRRAVASIWDTRHGLLLPSRAEGLPLVVVEAMMSGRVPIVTDVAGNGELIDDNETGFLAAAPTEDSLDEAMERAWQRRSGWRAIGEAAARDVRRKVPPDPPSVFADLLLAHADRSAASFLARARDVATVPSS
jgi:glycogen synthase